MNMNCERFRRDLFLARTGELTASREAELEKHLEGCAGCRSYAADLERAVAAARDAFNEPGPDPAVLSAIRREAGKRAQRRVAVYRRPWAQALAYAAAVLVLLGAWYILRSTDRSERARELRALMALVWEEGTIDSVSYPAPSAGSDLRALGLQLLRMEGLSADDIMYEAPSSTDPLSRNRRASEAKGCA
jgi:anti-sigma factor RsiW